MKKFIIASILLAPTIVFAKTCMVWPAATPAEPYDTWATAAPDIATAHAFLKANADGNPDEIILRAGTHDTSGELYVNWPCVIRGETGDPADVTVKGNGTFRLFTLNHAGAAVCSVTLTGGHTSYSGYYGYGAAVRIAKPKNDASQTSNFSTYNCSQPGFGGMVSNCIVTANDTANKWCASILYANASDSGNATITHCRIVDNWTSRQGDIGSDCAGSAVWIASGSLRHSLVADNYQKVLATTAADTWGGTVVVDSGLVMNCTVAWNAMNGANTCGGIVAGAAGKVVNCIVFGNTTTSSNAKQYAAWRGTAANFHNCLLDSFGALPGTGCDVIDESAFLSADADCHLAPGSPAIDAGSDAVDGAPLPLAAADLDGTRLPLDGDSNGGAAHDIGCFEFDPSRLHVALSCGSIVGYVPASIPLEAKATGFSDGDAISFHWDLGADGTIDAVSASGSYNAPFATAGSHAVSVICSNLTAGTSATAMLEGIRIDQAVYVAEDGDAEAAGTLEAPTSLDAAIARIATADFVSAILLPGTYPVASEIFLTGACGLRGHTGNPADVVLRRTGSASYRLLTIDNADAVVSGLTLENGAVKGNWWYGGAVRIGPSGVGSGANGATTLRGAGGTLSNCVVRGCSSASKWSGGAALLLQSDAALVTHCVITNNLSERQSDSSDYSGGIVYIRYAGTVRDSLVAYNTVQKDKMACTVGLETGGRVLNCTIVGNDVAAANGVGGINVKTAGEVVNCLVTGNTTTGTGDGANAWGGLAGAFVACATDTAAPINDTCIAPAHGVGFVNAAEGDWRLSAASPCRDAGSSYHGRSAGDLDGHPRKSGAAIDIGCYEFDAAAFSVGVTPSATEGFAPAEMTLSAVVSGTNGTDAVHLLWDVDGDGDFDAETSSLSWTGVFTAPGSYDVVAVATNLATGQSASARLAKAFKIGPRTLYVRDGNEHAAEPFDTPACAAASAQAAVDYAIAGAEVVMLRGRYELTSQILVSKPLTLRGETGDPADVVVARKAGKTTRCLEVNAGPDALVHSITLEGGVGQLVDTVTIGGGLYVHSKGGVVSNCVIRGCGLTGKWSEGGAFSLSGSSSLMTHCVVTNNSSSVGQTDGGAITGVAGDVKGGAVIAHSLIARNATGAGHHCRGSSTLVLNDGYARFCTVVCNVATNIGGINLSGTSGGFDHCVIAGNASFSDDPRRAVWGALNSLVTGSAADALANQFAAEQARAESSAVQMLVAASVNAVDDATLLGAGTVTAAPDRLMRNAARGDFRLPGGSPAIGVLPPASAGAMPELDLLGRPRLFGSSYDIGCYEWSGFGTMLKLR